ncbi:hypothetical protein EMMF5_002329 [Cystobasidiomycetes sp. EMM_F5]
MVCGHGCGHSADDPEHVVPGEGVNDLLLSKTNGITFWVAVDIDNVEILNAQEPDQFSNVPGIDFDSAAVEKPTQVINLVDSKDAVEYPVPATRYPAVTNLTLFFSENAGGETTQVYFIGFKGEFSKRVDRPGQIIYEATPNPADHVKFPGMGNEMHNTLSGQ